MLMRKVQKTYQLLHKFSDTQRIEISRDIYNTGPGPLVDIIEEKIGPK